MNKKENLLRTYPPKGLIIFLSIVIIFSILMSVGVFFLIDNLALKIVLWIFFGIFLILCLVVLLFEAINYLSLDETNRC